METHDRVMLGMIVGLLFLSITFASAYFYLYGTYTREKNDLTFCTDAYNDLSWQYYYNCTKTDYPNYSLSTNPYLYWSNESVYNTNNYRQEFFPKCTIETKVIYHHTWLEGGMEYYSTCLRCADLNQSIAPGVLKNGEWMCPTDTFY